jgi:hypothetical protein
MRKMKLKSPSADDRVAVTRITVSVPQPNYDDLLRIAESKRVSISWVVRDAVEKYLAADMPLFANIQKLDS